MGVCTKLCWKFAAVSGSTVRGDCFNAAIPAFMEEREGGWKCSNMEGIDLPLGKSMREKVGFIENTAMRHRWGGGREVMPLRKKIHARARRAL